MASTRGAYAGSRELCTERRLAGLAVDEVADERARARRDRRAVADPDDVCLELGEATKRGSMLRAIEVERAPAGAEERPRADRVPGED
jgi:hypothetical protein